VGKPFDAAPRVRLRDFLTPLGKDGKPDPKGQFLRPGVGVIYREDGKRMVAVRWGVRDGKRVAVRAEAKKKTAHLFRAPYLADWGGE